jgi:tetratricopeptide (TPR) repeat protein
MGNFQDALTYYQQSYQIQEKLKLTDDMAQSLENLAETNVDLGQYDAAMSEYLKALEIRRNSGDQNGTAVIYSGLGSLYTEQGKYVSALSALQESLKDFRQASNQTWLMAESMAQYGKVLSEVGRWDEGQQSLEDAVKRATEVKNDTVLMEALNYLGDNCFYRGEYGAAKQQYEHALQVATRAKSRQMLTVSKFNLAKLELVQNQSASTITVLKKVVEESDSLGLKALSIRASIYLAQALVGMKKPVEAQKVLDRALDGAEKLNLLIEKARAHYFVGEVLQHVGRPPKEYEAHYHEAVKILDAISKEPGSTHLLARSDLRDLYRNAVQWSQ